MLLTLYIYSFCKAVGFKCTASTTGLVWSIIDVETEEPYIAMEAFRNDGRSFLAQA